VIAVCPKPDATVMAAALEAGRGIRDRGRRGVRLFRVGGAHAIAALAYGTAAIPRVDKIVGPGNAYVAAAKALVSADCAIGFYAGPGEILIVSTNGRPAWIAADLIAQAEHDEHARAVLVTPSRRLATAVARAIARQMPGTGPAETALASNGAIVVTRTLDDAIAFSERMAPEHVVCDTPAIAARLRRAGTVFVGDWSAQASGDYVTGSNHVLPTSGAAAGRGGLSAADFVRVSTVQSLTRAGVRAIAPHGIALAEAEGLAAHANSIRLRQDTPHSRPRHAATIDDANERASEPRTRSATRPQRSERRSASAAEGASRGAGVPGDPSKRRASEGVGESEGRSPADEIRKRTSPRTGSSSEGRCRQARST
jgi:histidinol dehydrogenase